MEVAAALALSVTCVAAAIALLMSRQAAQARRRLEQVRDVDQLTGLPVRSRLRPWLDSLAEVAGTEPRFALFLVEIRRFEAVDDTYGHEIADALIAAVARSLKDEVGPDEFLARHRGPQFLIATADPGDTSRVRERAARLLDAVQQPYALGPERVEPTALVGCVLIDQGEADMERSLADAGIALGDARSGEKGGISLFEVGMRNTSSSVVAAHHLRRALEQDEFSLLYLPVVDLGPDHQVLGVEALLRWSDPTSGLADPDRFMPTLDMTGLIVEVGHWVLGEACRQGRIWQDQLPNSDFDVTVNISPRQLARTDFAKRMIATIEETGIHPTRLSVEVNGDEPLADLDGASQMLEEIQALGIGLTLDDFGAGRSSLQHLRHLRADALKIDRTLVRGLTASREDEAVVQQMVGLAHALEMRALAEGVEDAGQVEALRSLGCDAAQGYYFSCPQPAEVVTRLLVKGRLDGADRRELGLSPGSPTPPEAPFPWSP